MDREASGLLDLTRNLYAAIVEGEEVAFPEEAMLKEAEARSWERIEAFLGQAEGGEVIPFLPAEPASPLPPAEAARATLRKVFEIGIDLAGKFGLRENEVCAALEDALERRLEETKPPASPPTQPPPGRTKARLAERLLASPTIRETVDRFTRGEEIEAPSSPVEEILEVMVEAGTARVVEECGRRKFQILENRIPLSDRSSLAAILEGTRAVLEVLQMQIERLFTCEGQELQTLRHLRFLARGEDIAAFRKRLLQMLRAEVMKLDAHASARRNDAEPFVLHFGLAPAPPEAGEIEQKHDGDRKIGRL